MSTRDPNRFNFGELGSVVDIGLDVGPPGVSGGEGPPGPPGPPGPKGDTGPVNPGLTFNQNTASATWVVDHSMGKKPTIVTVDGNGRAVRGSVTYPSDSQVIINFSVPISGQAILN